MEPTLNNPVHVKIWQELVKRLKGIGKKDYVLHSSMVTKAMQEIIAGEKCDPKVMIPAAMLHDIGLSGIPKEKWFPKTNEEKEEYEKMHIDLAKDIITEILSLNGFNDSQVAEIVDIAQSHKSKDPRGDIRVACMVDADNLSDIYKEAFESDIKSYGSSPMQHYEFRSKNKFFTATANKIFKEQLAKRLAEIQVTTSLN